MELLLCLVAAWSFNKEFDEPLGIYQDSVSGLLLASADGLDHPTAAKIGAGAYACGNVVGTRLKSISSIPGPTDENGIGRAYSISVWWKAAAASTPYVVNDRIVEIQKPGTAGQGMELPSLQFRRIGSDARVSWGNEYVTLTGPANAWHHSVVTISDPYECDWMPGVIVQNWTSYLDGVPSIAMEGEWSTVFGTVVPVVDVIVGGQSLYFAGSVDALQIWQRELNADEVSSLRIGWEPE